MKCLTLSTQKSVLYFQSNPLQTFWSRYYVGDFSQFFRIQLVWNKKRTYPASLFDFHSKLQPINRQIFLLYPMTCKPTTHTNNNSVARRVQITKISPIFRMCPEKGIFADFFEALGMFKVVGYNVFLELCDRWQQQIFRNGNFILQMFGSIRHDRLQQNGRNLWMPFESTQGEKNSTWVVISVINIQGEHLNQREVSMLLFF